MKSRGRTETKVKTKAKTDVGAKPKTEIKKRQVVNLQSGLSADAGIHPEKKTAKITYPGGVPGMHTSGRTKHRTAKAVCNGLLQLLYPLRCPVCDNIVKPTGERICLECLERLKILTPPWCMKCGKKLKEEGEYCADCRRKEHGFRRGRALYEYESAALPIYRFKYGGRQEYAAYFGEQIAEYLGSFVRSVQPDALIPIPLHKKRKAARGYNQAELLARAAGRYLEVPVYTGFLVREKNTIPLKYENPQERQNNLKKAFNIARNDVKLEKVMIVDDIYTTGSTMDEVARVLKAAGVKEIYFITLAIGAGV